MLATIYSRSGGARLRLLDPKLLPWPRDATIIDVNPSVLDNDHLIHQSCPHFWGNGFGARGTRQSHFESEGTSMHIVLNTIAWSRREFAARCLPSWPATPSSPDSSLPSFSSDTRTSKTCTNIKDSSTVMVVRHTSSGSVKVSSVLTGRFCAQHHTPPMPGTGSA